jgi:hypothetical protein
MDRLHAGRNPIQILVLALLIVGLSACGSQPEVVADTVVPEQTPRAVAPRAAAPPAAETARVTVPRGTQMQVTLSTDVGSEWSQIGDQITATTLAPVVVGDQVAIPQGSTISGRVTDVFAGKKGLKVSEKGGSIVVSFDRVTTPQGASAPMLASISSIARSKGKTGKIIGGSAAGGALLGKVLGSNDEDIAIGAVVGGAIGTGIAAGTKGTELQLPAGTTLTMTLDQEMTIAART